MHELMVDIQNSPVGIWICMVFLGTGIFSLVRGGDFLVTGGLGLAKQLNVNTMVVGLTIIAFSTSSPELAFNIFAASGDHGAITIGNIFGSNIANLALVLGIGALVHNRVLKKKNNKMPVEYTKITSEFLKREGSWLLGSTLGISIITVLILIYGNVPGPWYKTINFNVFTGVILFLCFLIFFWHILGRHKKNKKCQSKRIDDYDDCSLSKAVFLLIGGFVLLIFGGKAAEIGAVVGARIFQISDMFIGVTIVALATSLPEVVTTIIAAKRDEADLIWGNIIGSNIFNVLFVLPVTLMVVQIAGTENYIQIDPPAEAWVYMSFMVLVTFVTWGMMKRGKDVTNKEGGALIGFYAVFLIGVTIWKIMVAPPG
jgi:cation:H+ antiporter